MDILDIIRVYYLIVITEHQGHNITMYASPEITIPNYYELDELPYLRVDLLNLQSNLSAKRMLCVRNCTYKNDHILAKIFVFFPKVVSKSEQQQSSPYKMLILTEMPVLSLQNFTYLLTELYQMKQLTQQEWGYLISLVQRFKQKANKMVEEALMADYQIKVVNQRSLMFNIYYCPKDDCFQLKAGFKGLGFQVSGFMKKSKTGPEPKEGFLINNNAVVEVLKQKLNQKLVFCSQRVYDPKQTIKMNQKIERFYNRQLKSVDDSLLQLKLKHNYPLLRQKPYRPIQFSDGHDGQPLIQPIISNKNKHCMYGHFNGYNSNNYAILQNSFCKFCGIDIKQMQENKLLMFLRDNLFNPGHRSILYCPEFNRFKILDRVSQVEIARRKLAQLKVSNKIDEEQIKGENIQEEGNQKNQSMKNQQENKQEEQKTKSPESQIFYTNYMHLLLTLKNMHSLSKNRLKGKPIKQVEYVNYVFRLQQQKGSDFDKYFQSFQLADPVRGKFCDHLQFSDLRVFYKSRQKKISFLYTETIYICPICSQEIKDSELMYLKQALVLIKFIKKLLSQPQEEQQPFEKKKESKIIKNSIRIAINHVQKRIFIEYAYQNSSRKEWVEIEKLYPTLVDPYIHFSQHSLGLSKKKNRKLEAIYNFGQMDGQSDSQRLEKQWYGTGGNKSFIV